MGSPRQYGRRQPLPGSNGALLHYNGTAWAPSPQSGTLTTNQLRGIWFTAANSIWVVGDGGVILNYDGTRWVASPQSRMITTSALHALFGAAPGDLWASGAGGTLLHYKGTSV